MVKVKHRYLLVEIIFGGGGGATSRVTDADIFHEVMAKVEKLHGDYGWASVRSTFQVKVCDAGTCIAILRVAAGVAELVASALPFVLSVASSDAILRLLYEGSSMRSVEKHLIEHNLASMYAQLRQSRPPRDQSALRSAVAQVTGANVAHLRL